MTEQKSDAVRFPEEKFAGLPEHGAVARRALDLLSRDERVRGLYLSGSFADGRPDRYSDIDIHIVVSDGTREQVVRDHQALIKQVGEIGTAFPATHLNPPLPFLIIVFYQGDVLIHADYYYEVLKELRPSRRDAGIVPVLDRDGSLARFRDACQNAPAGTKKLDGILQDLENRFWGWCHNTDAKIGRGELWAARDLIEYIRTNVLIPLADMKLGLISEGPRRLESKYPSDILEILARTVPAGMDQKSYVIALQGLMDGYQALFGAVCAAHPEVQVRQVSREYFIRSISR